MTAGKTADGVKEHKTLGKTKKPILLLVGSFNPYGNGQPAKLAFTWYVPTSAGFPAQINVLIGSVVTDGTGIDFGTLRARILPASPTYINAQLALVLPGDPIPTMPVGYGTGGIVPSTVVTRVILFAASASYNADAYTEIYIGDKTIAAGTYYLCFSMVPATGTGTLNTPVLLYTVPNQTTQSSSSATQDVVVVGIEPLTAPLWTSVVNPKVAALDPDLSSTVLEGSFNPYGNGQPEGDVPETATISELRSKCDEKIESQRLINQSIGMAKKLHDGFEAMQQLKVSLGADSSQEQAPGTDDTMRKLGISNRKALARGLKQLHKQQDLLESSRLNPYSGESVENLVERLMVEANDLPGVSSEYAVCVIDPNETMMDYPDSFDHADSREVRDKENHRVADSAKGREQPKTGGSPALTADTAIKERKQSKARQLKGVITRLVGKISSWGDVIRILIQSTGRVDIHMATSLVEACQRKNLADGSGADAYVAKGLAAGKDDGTILCGLSSWSRVMADLRSHPKWVEWYSSRFSGVKPRVTSNEDPIPSEDVAKIRRYCSPSEVEVAYERDTSDETKEGSFNPYGNGQGEYFTVDSGAMEMAARVHNKLMHALHGNTTSGRVDFPNSMEDITGGSSPLRGVFEDTGTVSGPHMDPIFEVTEQTGIRGVQGVTMSSVPRETALRGSIVNAANAITNVNDLNHPEALTWPLQVRNGAAAALILSTNRPQTFGIGLVRRSALNPAVLTSEGASIAEMVSRIANIRPNQATAGGFLTSDLAALIRLQPEQNGDSIVSLLVKSYLYQMSRCWVSDNNFLPIGGEPGKFDSYTSLAPNPVTTCEFNPSAGPTATLWNSNCENGVTAGHKVFPYVGGLAPTIAFHICMATVPVNQAFFFLRPGLLMQNDAGQESINIALAALLLAPYPCGIHQVSMSTLNSAGGGNQQQFFIPTSDLVSIDGIRTINIVLPQRSPLGPPTSQAAANDYALVKPTSGSAANPVIGAPYTPLNVSWVGNVVTYDLANFLNTWMDTTGPVDLTTLSRFSLQLCEIFSRDEDRRFAWELASTIGTRYPAMFAGTSGLAAQAPVNSIQSVTSQNFFALKPRIMTQDFPEQIDSYDFFMPDLNNNWWSKIMSGAFISTPDRGQYPVRPFEFDGTPRTLQYSIHQTRYYAMTAEACFTYMQMPTEVWNGAFSQLNYVSLLDMIRGFFAKSTQSVMNPLMADNGYSMTLAHCRITGTRPACDMFGGSIYDYLNVPRVGFQPVLSYAGLQYIGVTPGVIPDVWYQINNKFKCITYMPLLSSQKMLTGINMDSEGQVVELGGGSYTSPITTASQPRSVGLTTIPVLDDKSMFNAKLVWNLFKASLYTLDGAVYAAAVIPSEHVVCQKYIQPDWTVPALILPSLPTSKTNWIPYMNINGQRLAVGVTAANNATLMTQIMAARITSGTSMWLINGSVIMPNTIVMAGGTNTVSRMVRRPGLPLNESPSSNPAPEEGDSIP